MESHGLTDALKDNLVKQPADHIPKDDGKKCFGVFVFETILKFTSKWNRSGKLI